MRRRHFIGATAASVLLAPVTRLRANDRAEPPPEPDYLFFDERFPEARPAAVSWFASKRTIAVHGDVTSFWRSGLDSKTRERALRMSGVTTQSFLFCLRILADEYAAVEVHSRRLDRYLLRWTLLTTPNQNTGLRHG